MLTTFPARVFAVAVAVLGLAALVRYRLVEPQWIALMCDGDAAPWWCPLRAALSGFLYYYGFGYLSLAGALATLVLRRRWLVMATAAAGAVGTVLYNTDLAAPSLLLALVLSFGLAAPARG